jgi:hypothetical protein
MDRPLALQGGLGGMTTPDQILGGGSLKALSLTNRHLNGDRRTGIQAGATGTGIAVEGTGAIAVKATAGRASTLSELGTPLGTAGAERGSTLLRTGAEGPATVAATRIRTAPLTLATLEATLRTPAGGTGPAGPIRAKTIATTIAGTLRAAPLGTAAIGAGAIEARCIETTLTTLGTLWTLGATLALRTVRAPLTASLERPGRAEWATAAGTGALPLVPSTIKTGAHGRQANGL